MIHQFNSTSDVMLSCRSYMYLYLWIWNSSHANHMVQDPAKNLKVLWRSAKSKFTWYVRNTVETLMQLNCSNQEVQDTFQKYRTAFDDVESKHESCSETLEDDTIYEQEEEWMADVQETFISLMIKYNAYYIAEKQTSTEAAEDIRIIARTFRRVAKNSQQSPQDYTTGSQMLGCSVSHSQRRSNPATRRCFKTWQILSLTSV